jgi:hypothetical protein
MTQLTDRVREKMKFNLAGTKSDANQICSHGQETGFVDGALFERARTQAIDEALLACVETLELISKQKGFCEINQMNYQTYPASLASEALAKLKDAVGEG